jgi:hypothetical protein
MRIPSFIGKSSRIINRICLTDVTITQDGVAGGTCHLACALGAALGGGAQPRGTSVIVGRSRHIRPSMTDDHAMGLLHTTSPVLSKLAGKYRLLVSALRELVLRPGTPRLTKRSRT